jgi:uncharacterized protein DUF3592
MDRPQFIRFATALLGFVLQSMKRFLLLWFVGASLLGFGLGSFNIPNLYPLVRRGVETTGTVTDFEPNNHRTVHYSFDVNGKSYSGSQQGGIEGEVTSASSVSTRHAVFYLPEDPNVSCIGSPTPMLKNEIIPIALAMLFIPPFFLLSARTRYPAFQRWLRADTQPPG